MPNLTQLTEEGTSRTIQAGGTTIHYHEAGEGDPLILLHSHGPGSTAWITFHKVLPEFAKHFRCIAMDLPNYAKTGPLFYNEPTHIVQSRTVLALMDALGIEKAHIVGNSQGGQSSMVFAYKYPDRINKLVWGAGHIGTGGGYRNEYLMNVAPEEGGRTSRAAAQNPTLENFRLYLESHIYDQSLVTDELVEYVHKAYTGRPDLIEARAKSSSAPYDHSVHLKEITAPTLIIWGRHDRMCQFEIGINAFNQTPNAQLVVLHCGHWVPYEKPREYISHVLNFLKNN
jgi:pimeloyl-ACP methyl ester carboxylesterase